VVAGKLVLGGLKPDDEALEESLAAFALSLYGVKVRVEKRYGLVLKIWKEIDRKSKKSKV